MSILYKCAKYLLCALVLVLLFCIAVVEKEIYLVKYKVQRLFVELFNGSFKLQFLEGKDILNGIGYTVILFGIGYKIVSRTGLKPVMFCTAQGLRQRSNLLSHKLTLQIRYYQHISIGYQVWVNTIYCSLNDYKEHLSQNGKINDENIND